MLSTALKKCIDEKLSDDNNFKVHDFEDDVVDDIMERLKRQKSMNNNEVQCASSDHWDASSAFLTHIWMH